MPASIVKSIADKSGKSVDEVERLWGEAKAKAKEEGKSEDGDDFYPYVVGILKRMAGIKESVLLGFKCYSSGINTKK